MPELITGDELAKRLRVRPRTINHWRRVGWIPAVRINGVVFRYDYAEVVAALKRRSEGLVAGEAKGESR